MDKKELEEKRKELMQPGWTEDLHYGLKELTTDDAKNIVESMTEDEIWRKVNNRRFQEDYIADYLKYLWGISKSSFWKHIEKTLDIDQDLLWSDNMFHFEKLCQERIPDNILIAVLNYAIHCDINDKQYIETIGCVIKAQEVNFNRFDEMKDYIESITPNLQENALQRIKNMINNDCNYTF